MATNTLHIYTRVSTDVQGEEGFGLDLQLEAGKFVASTLDFDIKHWNEGSQSSTKGLRPVRSFFDRKYTGVIP